MSDKRRTKRQSILVQKANAGKITVASPHSIVEVAFACQYALLSETGDTGGLWQEPGFGKVKQLLAITSDQKTYSFQGDGSVKEFLTRFATDYELGNVDAVLRPSITWLGFNPQRFLDHLRLAMSPHFPYHAQHHLVDFPAYAVGSWAKTNSRPHLFEQAIKNLYGYELPETWLCEMSASADFKLITEVLSRQKVWE